MCVKVNRHVYRIPGCQRLGSSSLSDTLLRCAEVDLYRPIWSTKVVEEAKRAICRVHPDLSESRVSWRFSNMNTAFPFSEISDKQWEGLVSGVHLPDQDDRHVVAAAAAAGADVIVTSNLKDFPVVELAEYSLEPVGPDTFLCDMLDLNPNAVQHAVRMQIRNLKRPPMSVDKLLGYLKRANVPEFVADYRSRFTD